MGTNVAVSTPHRTRSILPRDATRLSPLAPTGPALVSAAHLAADLLAHPAPADMVS